MEIVNLELFILSIAILTMTPGLDTAIIIKNTARGGLKDGVTTSLGICSGLFVHASLSAFGVSAILLQSAELFSTIKIIGAIYLIWMGLSGIFSALKVKSVSVASSIANKVGTVQSLREGFLSNVLNPKTAVFYFAFLPQFINSQDSIFAQSLFLALIHFVIAMLWQSMIAFSLNSAKKVLNNNKLLTIIETFTGGFLVLIGLKLITEEYV
jgi:threonine/homoserine/homoserine lactone efflux protein